MNNKLIKMILFNLAAFMLNALTMAYQIAVDGEPSNMNIALTIIGAAVLIMLMVIYLKELMEEFLSDQEKAREYEKKIVSRFEDGIYQYKIPTNEMKEPQ